MWNTWSAPPKGTVKRVEVGRVEAPAARAEAGDGDEEVEQGDIALRRAHHQEAARAGPGEGALGDRRGERGRAHGVHGASPPREGLGARPRAQPVTGRDDADRRVTPAGRYAASSGPSRSSSSPWRSDRRMIVVASGSRGGVPTDSTSKTRGVSGSGTVSGAGALRVAG